MPTRRGDSSSAQDPSKAQRRSPGEIQFEEDNPPFNPRPAPMDYVGQAAQDAARYSGPGTASGGGGGGAPVFGLSGSGETPVEGTGLPTGGAANLSGEATSGLMSNLGGLAGGGKMDWTKLILGGLSLFGKDQPYFQPRQSFAGTSVDPTKTLTSSLDAIKALSADIAANNTPKLRNAIVPEGPAPVSIPGIPFQIGGGLGRDPALSDPSILEGSPTTNPFGATSPTSSTPKRRTS